MSYKNREYIDFLKQRFEEKKFIEFISDLLNLSPEDINKSIIELKPEQKQFKDTIQFYKFIANYSSNSDKIGTFIVKLTNTGSQNARVLQRTFISSLLNKYNLDASIVAFYQEDEPSWRLSFVKKELNFTEKGIKVDFTPAKRFSYLVGENESVHTAQEYLFSLLNIVDRKVTLNDIEKVFDVEKVTKKFFEEYKEKYLGLKEYLDKNQDFITESKICDFTSEEFAKKLMGQIVFLYFLQKKGWLGVQIVPNELSIDEYKTLSNQIDSVSHNLLEKYYEKEDNIYKINRQALKSESINENINNFVSIFKGTIYDKNWGSGDKQFVRNMFKKSKLDHKNDFFDEYLEPFFYSGLNEKRQNQYFPLFNCKIPFLNGGLFEPLNNYRWSSAQFNIPDEMFSNDKKNGILDIFDLYNFTIDEEEPLEKDIAVDPEMLGKIFENLLDVKDRKSTGSFYTPREIVHYMCQESLSNYIANKLNIPYLDILNFIKYGDVISQSDWNSIYNADKTHLLPNSIWNKIIDIDKALIDVKIADPAVGSGAFPLGMLNEIVKLRDYITNYIEMQKDLELISEEDYNNLINNRSIYDMKLQSIQNSIYAVDIEMSAVDIAKLRLWLSLIVDYPNEFEPRPLPNLDCKIMQGNSLLDEYEGVPLFSEKLLNNNLKNYRRNDSKLTKVNNIVFQQQLAFDDEVINFDEYLTKMLEYQKEYFITSDNAIKKELKKQIDRIQIFMVQETLRFDSKKLKSFNEIANKKSKPWFIWRLEFFDVFKNNGGFDIVIGNPPYINIEKMEKDEKKSYSSKYSFAHLKYDIYVLFFELGINIMNENGLLSYITSNKYFHQNYALKLREYLSKSTNIKTIINFEYDVFDSATVKTAIIEISKNNDNDIVNCINVDKKNNSFDINNLNFYQLSQKQFQNDKEYRFNITSNESDNQIINKIKSAKYRMDDIFFIGYGLRACSKDGTLKKKDFISDIKVNDNYKKYYEGKDLGNWGIKYKGNYVNYDKKILYNSAFEELFENEKLSGLCTLSDISKLRFIYDNDNYYCNHSVVCCVMWNKLKKCDFVSVKKSITEEKINISNEFDIDYVQGILNSKVIKYFVLKCLYDGTHFYPDHIKQLPIVNSSKENIDIVKKIVRELRNNNNENLMKQLNNKIYEIYNLSDSDIEIIENEIIEWDADK